MSDSGATETPSIPAKPAASKVPGDVLRITGQHGGQQSVENRDDRESPREMFTHRKLDYKRDLSVDFGDYLQAWTPNHKTNSMHSRTNGCIALMPTGNVQGTVRCFQLHNGAIVNRDNFTILPMPDHVVAHLNDLAARDKRPIQPDAAMALGNLENNVINNDVRPVEDAYLDPAVQVPRESATVQRADVTASVSEEGYVQQSDESQQVEADDGQLIQSDALPTDDSVGLKENLPETEDDRDEGNNVDAEKPNRPEDVPNEMKDLPLPMDDQAEQQPKGPYGLRSRANLKKPARYTVNMGRATRYYGFNMSVKKALATYKEEGFRVLVDELQQMINKGVMHPVRTCDLSSEQYKAIIRSSTFVKAKYKPDGSFDKLKARLVAGGNMQDRCMYEAKDISSPTVKQESVMMIAAIAAQEKRNVVTVDITGAYLNADMSKSEVHMRLDKCHAEILCALDPSYKEFLCRDGTVVVRLDKALYGCIESARLWYEHLSQTLIKKIGFRVNRKDACVFIKGHGSKQVVTCVHVDDLMITCTDDEELESVVSSLQKKYKALTVHRGR